jgi:hypothetical protein
LVGIYKNIDSLKKTYKTLKKNQSIHWIQIVDLTTFKLIKKIKKNDKLSWTSM